MVDLLVLTHGEDDKPVILVGADHDTALIVGYVEGLERERQNQSREHAKGALANFGLVFFPFLPMNYTASLGFRKKGKKRHPSKKGEKRGKHDTRHGPKLRTAPAVPPTISHATHATHVLHD